MLKLQIHFCCATKGCPQRLIIMSRDPHSNAHACMNNDNIRHITIKVYYMYNNYNTVISLVSAHGCPSRLKRAGVGAYPG